MKNDFMKKTLTSVSLLLLLLGIASFPMFVSAQVQPGDNPPSVQGKTNVSGDFETFSGVWRIVTRVLTWFYTIIFIVAVFLILWSAFKFITSKGDPGKTKEAKDMILYAAIGMAVALLSYAIVSLVKNILGGGW